MISAVFTESGRCRSLCHAENENAHEVAASLIDRGANVNARDKRGRTPFVLTGVSSTKAVLRALLRRHGGRE